LLHFILKYRSSDMFKYSKISAAQASFGQQFFTTHISAKVDVYDYAAQLNTLPSFETTQIPNKTGKSGYLVRVTVPGTNIVGEGYHPTLRSFAERIASADFKKKAEESHQGEKLLVKDINTLTSLTGQKFLQYCKMKQKDWQTYKFSFKQVGGTEVLGQLYLGDRLLSECTMFKYSLLLMVLMIVKRMPRQFAITWQQGI
jgi:hypothetical protein